jgi:hypothetical protein
LDKFYPGASKSDLVQIVYGILKLLNHDGLVQELGLQVPRAIFISFTRYHKRSKPLIIKWFVDHWPVVRVVIPRVRFADDQFRIVGG